MHEQRRRDRLRRGVPFYIYDKEDGVDWEATLKRILRTRWLCANKPSDLQSRGEVFFLKQLQKHRWRTRRPGAAEIFVLPVFMNVAENDGCGYTKQHVANTLSVIGNSSTFREHASKHLVVWSSPAAVFQKPNSRSKFPSLKPLGVGYNKVIMGTMECHDRNRHIVAPYNVPEGGDVGAEEYIRGPRPVRLFFGGSTNTRQLPPPMNYRTQPRNYYIRESIVQQWQNISATAPSIHPSIFAFADDVKLGPLPLCHDLSTASHDRGACRGSYSAANFSRRAAFVLAPRGETRTTGRPFEALAHGSIPVLISDRLFQAGLPFECMVPWRRFSVTVSEASFMCNAATALHQLISPIDPAQETAMRVLMYHFRRDVLWKAERSRVAENLLVYVHRKTHANFWPEQDCSFPDETRSGTGFFASDEKCRASACCSGVARPVSLGLSRDAAPSPRRKDNAMNSFRF